ncbi:MAG: GAF domain-containing protein, partial [Gammaproteobacteria bacterium]
MAFESFGTLRRIIQEVNSAPDLKQALNIIVQRVKRTMDVDAASVYFRDFQQNELVLMATDGLNQSAVGRVKFRLGEGLVGLVLNRAEPVNIADGPLHPNYRFMTETGEQVFHGFLGVPIIQHRVVLGVLVVRQTEVRRFAENDETFLVTLAAQLAGAISHAEAMGGVNQLLKEVAGASFTLKGISGSTGLAIGQAVVVYAQANLDAIPDQAISAEEVASQLQLFQDAVTDVARDIVDLSLRMQSSLPPAELALFDAYGMMLKSDTLIDGVTTRIRDGNWAQGALRDTIADHVRVFDNMDDPYLRERASDIRDLGRRILERLQSKNNQGFKTFGPTVLVGEEVAVSHLAEIPAEHLVAVVSAKGSGASHVAILSHAMGIPAVMGVGDLPVGRVK